MPQKNHLRRMAEDNGVIPLMEQADIFKAAIEKVKENSDIEKRLVSDFDSLIQEIESVAKNIYLNEENRYAKDVLATYVNDISKEEGGDLLAITNNEREVAAFYLSLIQGRKNRAGKTLERILSIIFDALGYPYDDQAEIDGKPDFILPSVDYYKTTPLNCIVFTSKRKLRERWREIVTEGMRGIGFYLGTIDEDISDSELQKMTEHKIFVVCPKSIQQSSYPNIANVLSYEQFFEEHLEPKARIWKREGLI